MILAEQIYKIIRNALYANGIQAYSDYIPPEIPHVFCMYEIVNQSALPDTGFQQDYETLRVRFNVYDDNDNAQLGMDMSVQIEDLFNRKKFSVVDSGVGNQYICGYKVDDNISYPDAWLVISDYEFVLQRDL